MVFPLCDLNAGETATVVWLICEPSMERRLGQQGFRFGRTRDLYFQKPQAGLSDLPDTIKRWLGFAADDTGNFSAQDIGRRPQPRSCHIRLRFGNKSGTM